MKHQRLIAAAYEKGVDEEYNRLTESVLREYEFRLVTQSVLSRVAPKAAILDIGCGPGRYAEFFLRNGFQVGLVDISANSLEAFSKRTRNRYLPQILFSQISCATDLDWIASQSVDAVVLLGPMCEGPQ